MGAPDNTAQKTDFIRQRIAADLAQGKNDGRVCTRFPPEPNGYLHVGHAKAICINFGIANDFNGVCNLRFDDTNPETETDEFQRAIKQDIEWLGFSWGDRLFHASDYFQALYDFAEVLINDGKAYVDSLSADEIRQYRGTLTEPGKDSPHRSRSVEENLDLFRRMRAGDFKDGEHVLRARIDMAAANINMRDPTLYRIRHAPHHRSGTTWCIYPMYDYAHCISDALEGITHSLCSLEYEDHRPLYDWILDQLPVACHPQQIEFARGELDHTITSKRKLKRLVEEHHVDGWDDPRLPTLSGLRRRGIPPAALREFWNRAGVTKKYTIIDASALEACVREDLDRAAPRALAVLNPLLVTIENYPDDGPLENLTAQNHPKDDTLGTRDVPFGRQIYIERDDFMESPSKDFFRLAPGREVRLRFAYFVTCTDVIKDPATGEVIELRCTYDPATRGGNAPDGRKVKGTIHWVAAATAVRAEVRLYDRLFNVPDPGVEEDFLRHINPASKEVLGNCVVEPSLAAAAPEARFQFERLGYFCADRHDHSAAKPVFNRTVTLRDTWAKISGR
ncbi:MAG: glutamine--tRNA ligase/YqeY domain fusion protein [Gammaproteobacteria bacterium]|nr:glutamine--tRNA ligase/YqeY domain fusion protein [Gammaproteobacteria bacterium]